ncbi:hypothetical protein TorRG33x02_144220 [Trema orientale]|uniref:Transmembrane protein n=1 Tax=Trema orientale TaxID=63057 RepID=A0A2P5EW23_TREOI|nr:hypothetical protein TorRG33x02_144220 [Trema orientale]
MERAKSTCNKDNNKNVEQMFERDPRIGIFELVHHATWALFIIVTLLFLPQQHQ